MPASKPHILFIVLDTVRRDRLSLYGHNRPTTPHLDEFAQQATTFERAIAAAQWTIPSHASMFTGHYPSTHDLTQASGTLPKNMPTLAELLRGAGYHTAAFCNNPLVGVLNHGLQRGFERFYNYASAAPYRPTEARRHPLHRKALKLFRQHLARPMGNQFAHSDVMFRLALNPFWVPLWTRLINFKGNGPAAIRDLIEYWESHQQTQPDQPMFAFLNLMGAHLPYFPPQAHLDRMAPELRNERSRYQFMRRFNAEAARWASPDDPPLADWEHATLNDFYDAEIAHQDEQVGKLLSCLASSGILENTVVVICADHGEGHGDHGFLGHGFVVYQELVHVPLVIRFPDGHGAGQRVRTNVSTRRLFHTALEAAGLPLPTNHERNCSLSSAAIGSSDVEQDTAFSEAYPPLTFLNVIKHRNASLVASNQLHRIRRALYEGDQKLVMADQQVEGLFTLPDDPQEVHNVAGDHPGAVSAMQRKLLHHVHKAESLRMESTPVTEVDESVVEHLRALGYIE
jgi:uncharacterized sulfatase